MSKERLSKRHALRPTILATLLALAACTREHDWHGIPVDPPREVPAFQFTNSRAQSVSTAPVKKHAMLVFFGYTNCPDVCPTTLADWARVKKTLGQDTSRVRFVFVSIDPERDTPSVAERYVAQYDAGFEGLSGDSATTSAIQKAFGVASGKEALTASGYNMGHSAQSFLVDDKGGIVVMWNYGAGWDSIAADLKQWLD